MSKRALFICILVLSGFFACVHSTQAGFGISPPFVKTKNPIFPGSHFEQKITLLRSTADEDLVAKIAIDAPDIADWITIQQGNEFDMPPGKLQVPITVMVDVPNSAEIGSYKGYLNIQVVPKQKNSSGGVAIALGARVDVDLEVTNEPFIDFSIRSVKIPDFELFKKPWNWKIFSYFFSRVKVVMRIENTGNVKVSPTKVQLDITNLNDKLLESHEDTSINQVEPFATSDVVASFPTMLGVGEYWGTIRIYQDNEIIHKDKLIFAVKPAGSLGSGRPAGAMPWIMLGGMIALILLIIGILIWIRIWRYFWRLAVFATKPLRWSGRFVIALYRRLKISFWQWMHKKAARYQDAYPGQAPKREAMSANQDKKNEYDDFSGHQ